MLPIRWIAPALFALALMMGQAQALSKTSNLTYGQGKTVLGDKALKLDIYQPDGGCSGGCPIVIYLHSGDFTKGSKDAGSYYSKVITAQGFALVSVGYRLAGDKPMLSPATLSFIANAGVVPELSALHDNSKQGWTLKAYFAAIEDVHQALSWIKAKGADKGLDPSQVVLWGSSAGAITALNVGYGSDQMDLQPAVPIAGVVDFWGALGPVFHLDKGEPPLFITHGERDQVVDFADSPRLAAAANAENVYAVFYPVPKIGHGVPVSEKFQRTSILYQALDFMDRALFDPETIWAGCYTSKAALCPQGSNLFEIEWRPQRTVTTTTTTVISGSSQRNTWFKVADANGSGALSKSELRAALKQYFPQHAHQVDRIFKSLDTNKDGKLVRAEVPKQFK